MAYIVVESPHEEDKIVLPDTCMVLALRFRGEVWRADRALPEAAITGIRSGPMPVRYGLRSGNLMVVFREGAAQAFMDEPLHELRGRTLAVRGFTGSGDIGTVDSALGARLREWKPDQLVRDAAEEIREGRGNTKIADLSRKLHISQDAFEKRFRRFIGTSPKRFSRIVRMKSIIEQGRAGRTLTDVAHDAGYFDQSHFIRDFKAFAGRTPSEYFAAPPGW